MAAHKISFTLTCPRPFTVPNPRPSILISSLSSPDASGGVHLIQFNGRSYFCLRRRGRAFRAAADQQGVTPPSPSPPSGKVEEDEEGVDSKILPYYSIDKKEKKSVGELEEKFLQALQAFYYEGKAIMSNEEFDNLI